MGKPIHLDLAIINKTRPSCGRVKVEVGLAAELPKLVEIEVFNNKTKESRIQAIKKQYDMLPKYCHTCKLQGHEEGESRSLHPELKKKKQEENSAEEALVEDANSKIPVQKKVH